MKTILEIIMETIIITSSTVKKKKDKLANAEKKRLIKQEKREIYDFYLVHSATSQASNYQEFFVIIKQYIIAINQGKHYKNSYKLNPLRQMYHRKKKNHVSA